MKRIALHTLALLGMAFSFNLQASTTWVPISVGDITTFIPYVPSESFIAPSNAVITTSGTVKTLSWDELEHASRYEIQAMNAQGEWVSILITEDTFAVIDSRFSGYSVVRIIACTYNSCADMGAWSATVSIKSRIIFIHTDLLGSPVAETDGLGMIK